MARRKKILDANTEKLVTYAIGAGITYFLVVKPILVKLGIIKSAEQNRQDRSNQLNIDDYIKDTLSKQSPTKSVGEWTIIADKIYNDLNKSAISDDKDDAVYQLARAKNDADVATLYKAFGKRQEYYFGIPYGGLRDLADFVKSNLSISDIAIVNGNYSRKNIKFKF
jgi:hypothetical protein